MRLRTAQLALAVCLTAACFLSSAFLYSQATGAGKFTGAGKITAGTASTARHFNGTSSDYLTRASNSSLQSPTTAITMACWVRYPSGASQIAWNVLVEKQYATGTSWVLQQNSNDIKPIAQLNSGGVAVLASAALNLDTWYFVVARWQANGYMNLDIYNVDGNLYNHSASAATWAGPITYGDGPVYVGNHFDLNYGFHGDLAQLYVDNTSLSDSDVQTLRQGTQPHAASAGYWVLGVGSPDPDSSGHGNDLTVNGTTVVSGPS